MRFLRTPAPDGNRPPAAGLRSSAAHRPHGDRQNRCGPRPYPRDRLPAAGRRGGHPQRACPRLRYVQRQAPVRTPVGGIRHDRGCRPASPAGRSASRSRVTPPRAVRSGPWGTAAPHAHVPRTCAATGHRGQEPGSEPEPWPGDGDAREPRVESRPRVGDTSRPAGRQNGKTCWWLLPTPHHSEGTTTTNTTKSGGVLLSHPVPGAVPSALAGLASGFGMGPGVSLPL